MCSIEEKELIEMAKETVEASRWCNILELKENRDNYDFYKEKINSYYYDKYGSFDLGYILVYASDRLRKNKVLNRMLVFKNMEYFKYMPLELRNDVNYVSSIISKIKRFDHMDMLDIYPYLGDKIKNDKDKIIKLYNAANYYFDKSLIVKLVKIPILKYVGINLLNDREFLHEFLELSDEDINYVINNLDKVIITEETCYFMHLPSDK